jgi:hypothetical protein
LFRAVNWPAREVGPSETGVSQLGILEGVSILLRYPWATFMPPPDAPPDKLSQAAEMLVKRLQMELGENFFSVHSEFLTLPPPAGASADVKSPPPRAKVPDDTMLILVGMKPISALISEKKAKAAPAPPK